jgi:hypothetical protein
MEPAIFPNLSNIKTIPFGTWDGILQIYLLNTDTSGVTAEFVKKTNLPLQITLSAVENNNSGIVKISFVNTKLGISQEILSYNQKCSLIFNQLSFTLNVKNSSIKFSLNGELEFISNNRLQVNMVGTAINLSDNTSSSVASQTIFNSSNSPIH